MVISGLPIALPPIQLAIAAVAVASAVSWQHRNKACIAFHTLLGCVYLLEPSLAYAHTVVGTFDKFHDFVQRFGGAYHLGFAFFYYFKDEARTEPVINFAKAITATFLTTSRLIAAYELYESKARGLHVSQNYLGAVLLAHGAWAIIEIYRFITNSRSAGDEIAAMCKRTQRWIEGGTSQAARTLFWIDAAVAFAYAFFNFAYPFEILRTVIRREFVVDEFHALYVRDFACHNIAPAIISLFAYQFPISHQLAYVQQRVATQLIVCLLHVMGHFYNGVYAPLHLIPFIIAFFYLALHVSIYFRVSYEAERTLIIPANMELHDNVDVINTTTLQKRGGHKVN